MLLAQELRHLRPLPTVPAHLADVPACLHKYEALLRNPPASAGQGDVAEARSAGL